MNDRTHRPAERKACNHGTAHGLRIVATRNPYALASCPCGYWRSAAGTVAVQRLTLDYLSHKEACDGTEAAVRPPERPVGPKRPRGTSPGSQAFWSAAEARLMGRAA